MSSIIPQTGVYRILCVPEGKAYIGKSVNIPTRWQRHKTDLRHNRHQNPWLQKVWNEYGEEAFDFEILELCSTENLQEQELYWISRSNCYNY